MALPTLGTYALEQTLGRSALGTTYVAERKGASMAIKVLELAEDLSASERQRASTTFRRRAEGVAALYHAGIVPLRDYGVAAQFLYAVSGLLPAGSLIDPEARRLLAVHLSIPIVLDLMQQIAQALQEAHRVNIAHGNLKPSNIFIAEERSREQVRLQVGDFLLISAERPALIPPIGQRMVWRYLAPESRAMPPTPAADQFALATIVYEWLTGRAAFSDVQIEQRTAITPITSVLPTLAAFTEVDSVFARAFAIAPQDRFASIMAFTDTLHQAFTGHVQHDFIESSRQMPVVTNDTQVRIDPNDTRPSREMPAIPPTPTPIQANPSAFLLDTPEIGPRPLTEDLQRMELHETLTGAADSSGKRRRGKRKESAQMPIVRGPTTREQELMAPPAAHQHSRSRQRQRQAPPVPPRMFQDAYASATPQTDASASFWDISLPRREVLMRTGKVALAAGATVGGILLLFKGGSNPSFTSWLQSFKGKSPHSEHIPPPITLVGHTGSVQALEWSPDATRLASGADKDGMVRLWDVTRPQSAIATLPTTAAKGITDLSWARDSHYLLVSAVAQNTQIWNVMQQSIVIALPYASNIARWHPRQDIAALATPTTKNIVLWDLTNAKLVATLTGHAAAIQALAWSSAASDLLLASGDMQGAIMVWEGASATTIVPIGAPRTAGGARISALAWATQSTHFLSSSMDGTVRLWDAHQSGSLVTLQETMGAVNDVTWLAGSTIAAIGLQNGSVVLWDSNDKQVLLTLNVTSAAIRALSWSPNGRYLAAGADDHTIYVWDTSQFG